jgi:hypothetical protein
VGETLRIKLEGKEKENFAQQLRRKAEQLIEILEVKLN